MSKELSEMIKALLNQPVYVLGIDTLQCLYAGEVERLTRRILAAIEEAGYICVGKGVIPEWEVKDEKCLE